ncbi:MAG: flagellar biosynthesis protein FliQ [Nitrospinota bacterium]
MTQAFVVDFGAQALEIVLLLSAPMLLSGLIVGVLVSIFQAVTSIQEMTLTFIPKVIAVMVSMIIFLPWMLQKMVSFTSHIIINLPLYIR